MTFPVIPLAFQRTVKIQRRQAGNYVNGRFVEPALIESSLIGSVQPATPKELRSKPEGEEINEGIKIYTNDIAGVRTTDIIVDGANSYRVFSVTPWNHHGYYKVLAGRINA